MLGIAHQCRIVARQPAFASGAFARSASRRRAPRGSSDGPAQRPTRPPANRRQDRFADRPILYVRHMEADKTAAAPSRPSPPGIRAAPCRPPPRGPTGDGCCRSRRRFCRRPTRSARHGRASRLRRATPCRFCAAAGLDLSGPSMRGLSASKGCSFLDPFQINRRARAKVAPRRSRPDARALASAAALREFGADR